MNWRGVTRENAPSEAGPANEPWQEQHWSETHRNPGEGRAGRVGGAGGTTAPRGGCWYNRKTGCASWVDPTQAPFVGDAGALVRPAGLFGARDADRVVGRGPRAWP